VRRFANYNAAAAYSPSRGVHEARGAEWQETRGYRSSSCGNKSVYWRIDVSVPESQLFVVVPSTLSVGSLSNICYYELLFGQVHVDIPKVVRAGACCTYRDHMARFLRQLLSLIVAIVLVLLQKSNKKQ
jgi:hypothetical protein